MKISTYPAFQPFTKDCKPLFDAAIALDPPETSELTFTNLYSFRNAYQLSIASLEDFILFRCDSLKTPRFFKPLGPGNPTAVIERVCRESYATFIRMPQASVGPFEGNGRFVIEEDRDNYDYLYKTEELVTLAGRKFDGKRNLIKKFKSSHIFEYMALDPDSMRKCLQFEERWCTIKDCDSVEGLRNERAAIREMADNFTEFGLKGAALMMEGKACAVCIGQRLNQDTMVMHILKADPDIPGLYQTMLHEFLKREATVFTYINLE
ncbi:MAG: phosphatidylglycerol lysyltransferase domain-containing protein, partial [Candidatus Omnitrophica bacterium]|nr:phosphatidylglycerol lysyltransferase domain-containing protein [Candidatus Omnitrophota bacterium]